MTNEVVSWADPANLDQAKEFASLIANSEMAGAHRGKPGNVLTCMIVAKQIDMPLLPVLQNVAIINSRPCIWGDLAIALARRHPACVSITETLEGEGDALLARCVVRRRSSDGSVEEIARTFSRADAMAAGLWGKNVWKQYPRRMLQMRARAFAIRDALPDATMGFAMAEEQADVREEPQVQPPKDRMRSLTAQIKGEPEPADMEHDPEPAEMPEEIDADTLVPTWKADAYRKIAACASVADLMALAPELAKVKCEAADQQDLRGAWKARKEEIEAEVEKPHPAEDFEFSTEDEA